MPALAATAASPAAPGSTASPFDRGAVLCLLIVVGAYMSLDLGGVRAVVTQLRLPDTDDAMRLAGVRDLVAGQPWSTTRSTASCRRRASRATGRVSSTRRSPP